MMHLWPNGAPGAPVLSSLANAGLPVPTPDFHPCSNSAASSFFPWPAVALWVFPLGEKAVVL